MADDETSSPASDDPMWAPIATALRAEMENAPEPGALGAGWQARVTWVRASTMDLMNVQRLYFLGFAVAKEEPARISEPTRSWVAQANTLTSANVQMCILASGLCSILDSVIREMAEAFVQADDVTRVGRKRRLEPDAMKAREQLVRWTSPTAKAEPTTWCERLGEVFDLPLSDALTTALVSLVTLRHAYIHERAQVLARRPIADEATSWCLAVMLVAALLGQRMSERAVLRASSP
ncbi:MAG TPA: hypothetical protein VFQ35_06945 [Polyangiaceae bacterium]|nr:hypothetical protein [Polyangiaceae bacterium]